VPVPAQELLHAGSAGFISPTVLRQFDMIVSMPKMKTHHWAGVTLSMKNLFGLVPGRIYGWPRISCIKHDIGRSIVDINATNPGGLRYRGWNRGMQGNGPIQGTAKSMGLLAMGRDAVAVDATCCRLMGIDLNVLNTSKPQANSWGM